MSLRVTIVDEQTGDTETIRVADDDYLLTTTGTVEASIQSYPLKGTHILTLKNVKPKPLRPVAEAGVDDKDGGA